MQRYQQNLHSLSCRVLHLPFEICPEAVAIVLTQGESMRLFALHAGHSCNQFWYLQVSNVNQADTIDTLNSIKK